MRALGVASLKDMREQNRARLLQALRAAGSADRAELVRRTGLSRPTVSALVAEAIARGHMVEEVPAADRDGRQGRPSARLRLDPGAGMVAGVDFGHGHGRVALADLTGTVLAEQRAVLDVDASSERALDTAAALLHELLAEAGAPVERVVGVGLGVPAPVDRSTGAVRSTSILPGWAGVRPAEELSARLRLPVRLDNDANLGALGELRHGAARGAADVLYVKVASGVGAGIVLDGELFRGADGVAGELGHVALDPVGRICRCGNRGCLETLASTAAVARALAPGGPDPAGVPARVEAGDPAARAAAAEAGRAVGRALGALWTALDPELVVVGGELGAASPDLQAALEAALAATVVPRARVIVRRAALGDRAELLGAVALALGEDAWLRRAGLIALTEAAA
jgi:predicted NBD/HSP70 family sugar kinase